MLNTSVLEGFHVHTDYSSVYPEMVGPPKHLVCMMVPTYGEFNELQFSLCRMILPNPHDNAIVVQPPGSSSSYAMTNIQYSGILLESQATSEQLLLFAVRQPTPENSVIVVMYARNDYARPVELRIAQMVDVLYHRLFMAHSAQSDQRIVDGEAGVSLWLCNMDPTRKQEGEAALVDAFLEHTGFRGCIEYIDAAATPRGSIAPMLEAVFGLESGSTYEKEFYVPNHSVVPQFRAPIVQWTSIIARSCGTPMVSSSVDAAPAPAPPPPPATTKRAAAGSRRKEGGATKQTRSAAAPPAPAPPPVVMYEVQDPLPYEGNFGVANVRIIWEQLRREAPAKMPPDMYAGRRAYLDTVIARNPDWPTLVEVGADQRAEWEQATIHYEPANRSVPAQVDGWCHVCGPPFRPFPAPTESLHRAMVDACCGFCPPICPYCAFVRFMFGQRCPRGHFCARLQWISGVPAIVYARTTLDLGRAEGVIVYERYH